MRLAECRRNVRPGRAYDAVTVLAVSNTLWRDLRDNKWGRYVTNLDASIPPTTPLSFVQPLRSQYTARRRWSRVLPVFRPRRERRARHTVLLEDTFANGKKCTRKYYERAYRVYRFSRRTTPVGPFCSRASNFTALVFPEVNWT